ncbi:MAG: peptidylprolyl isomerase [Bacteroidales bacterium]
MNHRIFSRFILAIMVTLTGLAANGQDQVLMTIDGKPVMVSEFTRILNKNRSNLSGQKTDINESLDLYINFRLKVLEAESLGLDTTARFKAELEQYRVQLAKPYLMDQEVTDELVYEAYERSQWEVRASHIMVAVRPDASSQDTLIAYRKAMAIRDRIAGGEDFSKVAAEVSEDPSARVNSGDLGYFSALWMVYPFENAVYSMKIGDVSQPVRTQFGYHILTLTDKRPARGKIQVTSIWKAFNYGMSDQEKARIREEAESIYLQLRSGADFGELFRKYSDDRNQSNRGDAGYWFGINEKEPAFEEAAFALQNVGDYTEPVATSIGYFIIRLLDRKPPETFEEAKSTLYFKISRLPDRAMKSESAVIDKLKKEYDFQLNQANFEEFYRMVDPSIFESRWDANPALAKTGELFTLGGHSWKQADFARYLALNMKESSIRTIGEYVDDKFNEFVRTEILKFEETQLTRKFPEYRDLYQEFRDGNLFFEIADKKVWSKASQDSAGLAQFFAGHRSGYMWPERLDAMVIDCKGSSDLDKMIEEFRNALNKNCKNGCDGASTEEMLGKIASKYQGNSFEILDRLFSKGDQWMVDQIKWKKGLSEIFVNPNSKSFVWVNQVVSPQPKKLEEIKGLVIADYQDYLDKEWVKDLRQKYQVKINRDVLSQIKL